MSAWDAEEYLITRAARGTRRKFLPVLKKWPTSRRMSQTTSSNRPRRRRQKGRVIPARVRYCWHGAKLRSGSGSSFSAR